MRLALAMLVLALLSACNDSTHRQSACSAHMVEKYGVPAFLAINDRVIAGAVAAPVDRIGPTFQALAVAPSARQTQFKTHLGNFLVYSFGGTNAYAGRTMEKAHMGLNIDSTQYDYFVTDVIVPALYASGVSKTDITDCFMPVLMHAELKASVINR